MLNFLGRYRQAWWACVGDQWSPLNEPVDWTFGKRCLASRSVDCWPSGAHARLLGSIQATLVDWWWWAPGQPGVASLSRGQCVSKTLVLLCCSNNTLRQKIISRGQCVSKTLVRCQCDTCLTTIPKFLNRGQWASLTCLLQKYQLAAEILQLRPM